MCRRVADEKYEAGDQMTMKHVPKETTDADLIQQYLDKGGKISKGKTKPMPHDLGISNGAWNNKLTKHEKAARDGKLDKIDTK